MQETTNKFKIEIDSDQDSPYTNEQIEESPLHLPPLKSGALTERTPDKLNEFYEYYKNISKISEKQTLELSPRSNRSS